MKKHEKDHATGNLSAPVLEAVVNAIPDPVFYKDTHGRYLGCNDAFIEFVGKSRNELLGKTVSEVWESESAQVYEEADQALSAHEGKQVFEGRVKRYDGCVRDVIFRRSAFAAEQEKVSGGVVTMVDITAHKERERSLEQSRKLFIQAFWANPSLIAISNPEDGRFVDVNKAWLEGMKYKREDVIGKTGFDLDVWADWSDRAKLLAQLTESGCVRDYDAKLKASDGSEFACLIEIDKISAEGKELVLWTASDISRRKELEKDLHEMARTDSLTRLPNRLALFEVMEHAERRVKRRQTHVAVMVLDLDGFKQVNDDFGHLAGDDLLVQIAGRLTRGVRETDFVARLGGDEFAIILEDLKTVDDISTIASHIVENITGTYNVQGFECRVGVSIGISVYDQSTTHMEELLQQADKALYDMKGQGKGSFVFYRP